MDELRELYQEMILDHHKNPRNFHGMDAASHAAEGYNPLCGDKVTVYLQLDRDTIKDISFEGSGCAICTASTSVMTELLQGKTLSEAEALFGRFRALVTSDPGEKPDQAGLGKLVIFAGVREYPIRIKCATLPWHTMQAALEDKSETVSTE
ncbi:MAG: SUF system NifU family Fe-S cluster assembly protein [Candidatus Krumholzibacteria bacterium]|nr:SUF system NifU family Fe-S cluster assembly protein [Candidatus Krumholzibacteria bacterium]